MPNDSPPRKSELFVVVGGLVLFAAGIGAWVWPAATGESRDGRAPGGASLGMSEAQVRERMKRAPPGAWSTAQEGKVQVLTWRAAAPTPKFAREIRFEIHEGLLTAVRAQIDPADSAARGPEVEITPMLVTARRPRSDGAVDYTSIARDCTVHADEVNALLGGSRDAGR